MTILGQLVVDRGSMNMSLLNIFGDGSAGPKGTDALLPIVHWWFWDDLTTPGLMTADAFHKVQAEVLSADELSLLGREISDSRFSTSKSRQRLNIKTAQRLLKKLSRYLVTLREADLRRFDELIISEWRRSTTQAPMLEVLKAYIDVLDYWGYPFGWQMIEDARRTHHAVLLLTDGKPTHFFKEEDIIQIKGRPTEFSISLSSADIAGDTNSTGNWSFSCKDAGFDMPLGERDGK